eukprot:CAMPEP_0206243994 /NCGR_PEP_ID=MMETSP0047_2-20121206/17908_1 /ASSEMBLY_ACC=CAM_ASM_000192 /TAXON_ID=195065 /ORGANISM="Chroomonas mesostigmatica_cf, Strain CCMP1168" /LENGTH=655 /DNA_ID=CAMNT_0053669159 /DNA_START=13 /DNA_END=1977 /DNA_ORIENTATION=+
MAPPYDHEAIHPHEYTEAFEKYVEGSYQPKALIMERLVEVMVEELDVHGHYPVEIDLLCLLDFNQRLGTLLIHHPTVLLPFLEQALINAQKHIKETHEHRLMMDIKDFVHARLTNPPGCGSVRKANVSSLRSNDVGRLISVAGTVIRAGLIKMLEAERTYECAKCKHEFKVFADTSMQQNMLNPPTSCPSVRIKPCKSTVFNIVEGSRVCTDYQEIKIQEQIQSLEVGSIPRNILVVLQDDLVDKCKPGDDIQVVGILKTRWRPLVREARPDVEMVLSANHVRVRNEDKNMCAVSEDLVREFEAFWADHEDAPLRARNHVVSSICPQLHGLQMVKLPLLLSLIGGVARVDPSGTRIRGESHCLIIGDPGLGKSQLLKYAAKLSTRSVHTTGIGTTSAGLTVTAQRDAGGEWVLEAGALVLSDGGLCCIDEFDCVKESDRTTIHEAMEQQTISVAKAGLVCKLNTRTTVLAATNPKGKFNPDSSIGVNCALGSPLLSRFDVVLILIDAKDEVWDKAVSDHVLQFNCPDAPPPSSAAAKLWDIQKLQMYIAHIKQRFQPMLTAESEAILTAYYKVQRGSGERNAARTTIRMLESMIRLAQAHARLMFRDEVTAQDALVAVTVLETSQSPALHDSLHQKFAEDPDGDFERESQKLLRR